MAGSLSVSTRVLAGNLEEVRRRIEQACRRCGRSPSSVTLVAVTKNRTADEIQEALVAGITDLGENRLQEADSTSWASQAGSSGVGVPVKFLI